MNNWESKTIVSTNQLAGNADFSKEQQGWTYTEIFRYPSGDHFRVVVYRDAYDHQSYARAYKWSDEGGWKMFDELPTGEGEYLGAFYGASFADMKERDFYSLYIKTAERLWRRMRNYFPKEMSV